MPEVLALSEGSGLRARLHRQFPRPHASEPLCAAMGFGRPGLDRGTAGKRLGRGYQEKRFREQTRKLQKSGSRLQACLGVAGLAGLGTLKNAVSRCLPSGGAEGGRARSALKALTYAAICVWTFLLSQLVALRLLHPAR